MNANNLKPIKISVDNASKINATLAEVNGRAIKHAYTNADEIIEIAEMAEEKIIDLLRSQKDAVGAKVTSESGCSVANSYSNSRIGTRIVIERRSTGWFLIDIQSCTLYNDGGRKMKVQFTAEQDAKAISILRKRYSYTAPKPVSQAATA